MNLFGDETFQGNHQAGSHLPDGGQTGLLTLPYQAGKGVEDAEIFISEVLNTPISQNTM